MIIFAPVTYPAASIIYLLRITILVGIFILLSIYSMIVTVHNKKVTNFISFI